MFWGLNFLGNIVVHYNTNSWKLWGTLQRRYKDTSTSNISDPGTELCSYRLWYSHLFLCRLRVSYRRIGVLSPLCTYDLVYTDSHRRCQVGLVARSVRISAVLMLAPTYPSRSHWPRSEGFYVCVTLSTLGYCVASLPPARWEFTRFLVLGKRSPGS